MLVLLGGSCAGRIDTAAMVMLFPAGLNVFYSDPERHLPGKILRASDEIFPYNDFDINETPFFASVHLCNLHSAVSRG